MKNSSMAGLDITFESITTQDDDLSFTQIHDVHLLTFITCWELTTQMLLQNVDTNIFS